MRARVLSVVSILFIVEAVAFAAQGAGTTTFDVASVSMSGGKSLFRNLRPARFPHAVDLAAFGNLQFLIACAFRIPPARAQLEIVGLPKWADDDVFEIEAKSQAADVSNFTAATGLTMLRALLAERFKLDARYQSRTVPTYASSSRDATGD